MSESHSVCSLNREMFQLGASVGIMLELFSTSFVGPLLCLVTEKPIDSKRKCGSFSVFFFHKIESLRCVKKHEVFSKIHCSFSCLFSAAKRILLLSSKNLYILNSLMLLNLWNAVFPFV